MINGETMVDTPSKDILYDKLDVKKPSSPSAIESLYKRYESLPLAQQIALGVAPGTGEAISAYETPKFAGEAKEAFDKGEYLEAAGKGGLATLSALGAIPGLGLGIRAIKGGAKAATKLDEIGEGLSRMRSDYTPSPIVDETADVMKALGKTEDDIVKFRQPKSKGGQKLEGSEKEVYKNPDLEEQAIALDEGLITLGEFKEARDILKPRKTYGTVPKLYENFDIIGSLPGAKGKEYGIVGVNKNLKSGELVSSRFDIPAYRDYGRYVVTIRKGNELFGYAPTAILKNVKFTGNPDVSKFSKVKDPGKKSFNIAKGGGKGPFAVMEGKWQNMSPESTHKYAEDLMDAGKVNKYGETGKEWTEIGFDPASKSSFYNRSTGEPIFAADKVVQIGPMLLARGIKKPTKEQLKSLEFTTKAGKKIKGYKEGGQIMPMQYGGGLDDAYMNRRRSSAFAAPDATSAFASPMSMGGLPTIYRSTGSGISYEDMMAELDQEDADAGAASLADDAPDYGTLDETGIPSQAASIAADRINAQVFADIGRREGDSRLTNYNRGNLDLLSQGAYNALLGTGLRDSQIANLTAQQLSNFQSAYDGKSFGGDLGADDFSKGYRYGGARGTIQDILEKGAMDRLGLKDYFEELNEKKPTKKKEGIEGLIDKGIDMFSLTKNMTPESITSLNNMLAKQNFEFTPNNKFASGVVSAFTPLSVKLGRSLLGGEKTVGTITNKETGTSYQVGDRGGLTLNTPDPTVDYGSDAEIKEEEEVVTKKTPEEVKEESSMDKNINLKKERRVDPNVKIIMDIYNMTEDEANRFLGNEGVGTGGAGEFEGI